MTTAALDLISHACSYLEMSLIVRHRSPGGYTRRVQSMSEIAYPLRPQWEIVAKVPGTAEEILHRYGTGLPPRKRPKPGPLRRFG